MQDFIIKLQDDEFAGNENWISQMEELAYMTAHPIDINTATKEKEMGFSDSLVINNSYSFSVSA